MEKVKSFNFNSKFIVVKFGATWCMPCKTFDPILKKMSEEFSDIKFLSVDVDEAYDLAEKYAISSVPTTIFFKDGEIVDQIVGTAPTSSVRSRLKSLIK